MVDKTLEYKIQECEENNRRMILVTFNDNSINDKIGEYRLFDYNDEGTVVGGSIQVFEQYRGRGYSKHMINIIVNQVFPSLVRQRGQSIVHKVAVSGFSSYDGGFLLVKYWKEHGYKFKNIACYEKAYELE